MKKLIFLPFLFITSTLFSLTYDSGNYGISTTENITISTLTVFYISVSTITASSSTFTSSNITTLTSNSGTFNSILVIPSNAAPRTNVTPTSIGQLIRNTGTDPDEICFSTGTTLPTWVLIRSANTACSN